MQVIRNAAELDLRDRRVCLAIGMFDGVHLGHQQVIRQAIADAEHCEGVPMVVTFDRHPNTIVAPERVPQLIYSLPQRVRAIAALGVNSTWLLTFDKPFSQRTGEEFVRMLVHDLGNIASICVGHDFHFGAGRGGNVGLLKKMGADLGFNVHGLASVALDAETVSSTRIRDAIRRGQFDSAGQMLGRDYGLAGEVMRGDGVGHQLGFPTANIHTTGLVLPPAGVYAVHAHAADKVYRGALNIGYRPTLEIAAAQIRVEAHLLGFAGDLYGQELEITFVEKLRDEMKFPSLAELQHQIADDVAKTRKIFAAL